MKKSKLSKLIISLLVITSVLALNPVGVSAEWKQDNRGWWYSENNSWAIGWRQLDGKWYYFYDNGYMAKNTILNGYELGADGAWVMNIPIASTTSTSSDTASTKKYIGFDEMPLSSGTSSNLEEYYNQSYRVIDGINTLGFAEKDYVKEYKKGNILGKLSSYSWNKHDYCFNLNNKFNRFTAIVGMDDYYNESGDYNTGILINRIGTITIIGDGNVLETKNFRYAAKKPVNIDVDVHGCDKLIIRIQISDGVDYKPSNIYSYYDILNGKFYYK